MHLNLYFVIRKRKVKKTIMSNHHHHPFPHLFCPSEPQNYISWGSDSLKIIWYERGGGPRSRFHLHGNTMGTWWVFVHPVNHNSYIRANEKGIFQREKKAVIKKKRQLHQGQIQSDYF